MKNKRPSNDVKAGDSNTDAVENRVRFGRYRRSRFWAIWVNDQLLVVTVYRKGALAVLARLGLESVAVEVEPLAHD